MSVKMQTQLTRVEMDAWLKRLRDPNSEQYRCALRNYKLEPTIDQPMCCLEHLCVALGMVPASGNIEETNDHNTHYRFVHNKIGVPIKYKLIIMNDFNRATLLQIADYIETNLAPCD